MSHFQTFGFRVAGKIFGIMSLVQLIRFVTKLEILVTGYQVPLWLSALAFIVLAALGLWMLRLSCTPSE